MFPITVTIHTAAQFNAVMAVLNVAGIDTAESATEAAQGRSATARKSEGKKPETTETPNTPRDHADDAADAPTYQDAAHAITRLARAKGRDAAVAVLARFGAARLPDVEPEQFAAIVAACDAAGA